ncbi:MAG: tRNA (N(6)-L-threonylcarbamoyladenosine(37)-C(2))-methylthiotransferase MtaB [Rhizobiales bacterium]|nr:tRNA (N(6)-L-threonylcarbamoyladenosine(37)-C(2))-methylthiotransferase MtaB [Hyphomicrobiales bacterium]
MTDPTIMTFGCRLNAYESEVMRAHITGTGLGDTIVVNTCAVTAEAVRQARQAIRKARRENPSARIIVTGCAAQIDPRQFAEMDEVDHVVGNAEKLERATFEALAGGTAAQIVVGDIMQVRETAGHLVDGFGTRARAYVQVQNGCDHRCTFCIIPFGRGNSRSVPAGEVVTQIGRLVEAGYREVVLTGVDLTSYGADLPGRPSLGNLTRRILKLVPGLARLRLSSIDSIEADAHLMRAIAEEERLMPHLHLSLQAGHDIILKRMKRRHLRADAIAFCQEARRLRPDIVFGADLIAGFPTESDEMFDATLALIEECGLTHLHVFPFSPRPETPAARMPQLPKAVVRERADRLRRRGHAALAAHLDAQAGRTLDVLMETASRGRARDFTEVELGADVAAGIDAGSILMAEVTGHDGARLRAIRRDAAGPMVKREAAE